MAVKPTVLLYNFTDKRRRNKVNTFCAMHGIRVRAVEKESYEKPVLALIDKEAEALFEGASAMKENEPETGAELGTSMKDEPETGAKDEPKMGAEPGIKDFSEEMLLMCNVGSQMNPFLSYLRKEKILVPLKAVLTPTNQFWSSVDLYAEIKKEHEQMTGQSS